MDWNELTQQAVAAKANAYAPYSKFPVGAAALTSDGKVVTGANVENASYGLTLCAECSLVSDLARQGGGKLARFVCVGPSDSLLMPCGRCRQLLAEHAASEFLILTQNGEWTMEQLLPGAFGPADLGR